MKSKKLLLTLLVAVATVGGSVTAFANTENIISTLKGDSALGEGVDKNATVADSTTLEPSIPSELKGDATLGENIDKNATAVDSTTLEPSAPSELKGDTTLGEGIDKNASKELK